MANILDYYGFNPPFLTPTSLLNPQAGLRIIRNDILQLLQTGIGERVMRPTYGTLIRNLPFEPNDSSIIDNLRENILSAMARYENRVTVRDLIINPNPDTGTISISLLCYLRSDPNQTIFPVDTLFASPTTNPNNSPNLNTRSF